MASRSRINPGCSCNCLTASISRLTSGGSSVVMGRPSKVASGADPGTWDLGADCGVEGVRPKSLPSAELLPCFGRLRKQLPASRPPASRQLISIFAIAAFHCSPSWCELSEPGIHGLRVELQRSRKLRRIPSSSGSNRYRHALRSVVGMNTSACIPGESTSGCPASWLAVSSALGLTLMCAT